MAEYPCDNEDGNYAVLTLTSHVDPSQPPQFLCGMCFAIYGIALARESFPELLQDPDAEPAAPAKRTRKGRTKDADDYDAGRTIAAVVETEPRDESVAGVPVTAEASAAAALLQEALDNDPALAGNESGL